MAATDSGHSKNGLVNIKFNKQMKDRPYGLFTLIFYNVIKNDMYQCKQWIQFSSISYYKGYIQKFSYSNFPEGGGDASGPQSMRAALNPNNQLP